MTVMAKCDRKLLQRVAENFYKVWQVLQSAPRIFTNCGKVLQSMKVIIKWDVTPHEIYGWILVYWKKYQEGVR